MVTNGDGDQSSGLGTIVATVETSVDNADMSVAEGASKRSKCEKRSVRKGRQYSDREQEGSSAA